LHDLIINDHSLTQLQIFVYRSENVILIPNLKTRLEVCKHMPAQPMPMPVFQYHHRLLCHKAAEHTIKYSKSTIKQLKLK